MQHKPSRKLEGYLAGALVVVLGLATIAEATSYRMGELARMGPGYFPVVLGIILMTLGFIIPYAGDGGEGEDELGGQPVFVLARARGMLCIVAGVLAFIVLGQHTGMAPAAFALVFIAAMGDSSNTVKSAALLALVITILGIVVFSWALQLQFPVFRWG